MSRVLPGWLSRAVTWPILIVGAPFWILLVLGLYAVGLWADRVRADFTFRRWFAWRPVRLDGGQGPLVWLEYVERARGPAAVVYRRPDPERRGR